LDLNLCILSFLKGTGGISTYTFELARMLGLRGLKVHLVANGLTEDHRNLLEKANVSYTTLKLRFAEMASIAPVPYYLHVNKEICKQLRDISSKKMYDLLHFTSSMYGIGLSERKFVVTNWCSLSSGEFVKSVKYYGFPRNFVVSVAYLQHIAAERVVHEKASKIICPTKPIYYQIAKEYEEKVHYIPPPLNLPSIASSQRKRIHDKSRILFIANELSLPKKNLKTLLKSLRLLSSEKLTRKILVTLVGVYNKRLMNFINRQKNPRIEIEITGPLTIRKLESLYKNSDVLVFPSFYDDLGYVVLEAMSHGLPIIASEDLPILDFVENNKTGLTMNPHDPRDLAKKLTLLICDDEMRRTMGNASLKKIHEICDPQRVSQQMIGLYLDALTEERVNNGKKVVA